MTNPPQPGAGFLRGALCAAIVVLALGAAAAQTPLTPVAPDPQTISLVDRVDALRSELDKATAENERLQHELSQSQAEVARLQKIIDDANAAQAPAPAATSTLNDQLARHQAAPGGDPKAAFNQAYSQLAQGAYDDAESGFRDFLAAYPSSPLKTDAHYWLGASLLAQNKNADAAEQFLGIVKSSPKSAKAPDAYLNLGIAFKQMGQAGQACPLFRDVPVKFPNASAAVKAKAAQRAKSCPP